MASTGGGRLQRLLSIRGDDLVDQFFEAPIAAQRIEHRIDLYVQANRLF
jgi:hypothetical protein